MKTVIKAASGRWRVFYSVMVIVLTFTAFMGFAHTPAGRPLLKLPMMKWMGMHLNQASAVCPMGYNHLETAADRQHRRDRVAALRSELPFARSREALDFVIGQTPRNAIERWALANGGNCTRLRSSYESECSGRFFHANTSTLWLEFDSKDRLISARGIEEYREPESALALFARLKNQIKSQAGTRMIVKGPEKIEELRKGLLRQVSVLSDFRNYSVNARLTNMGDKFAVTHDFIGY
jgi:hypothetical protein